MTREQILDAIASIQLHHFPGTTIVVCCVLGTDGRAHVGVAGSTGEGEPDLSEIAGRARIAAEQELEKSMKENADGNG